MTRLAEILEKHRPILAIKNAIISYKVSKAWRPEDEKKNPERVLDLYDDIVKITSKEDEHLDAMLETMLDVNNRGKVYVYTVDRFLYHAFVVDFNWSMNKITILKDHLDPFKKEGGSYKVNSRRRIIIKFNRSFDFQKILNLSRSFPPSDYLLGIIKYSKI